MLDSAMKAALGLGSFFAFNKLKWIKSGSQNAPKHSTPAHPLHPAFKLRSFHSQADARPADPHYVKTSTLRL